ncbi:FtsK/SpoIIIE domain-containing protein [Mycobacteroides abscessus]|uniref:FtsK/SpoIIIE domain-containing protein n=1 Tax=Mycobacteroides abscessus TaxID=36809 RepID=UPI0019D204B9|nr:FtsK/SpoIIIE domain-containing protein [Mycobacteroides abscessus]MBN7481020.1 hypothetical protein [Mycobacteroides abscessus subsp. massiliense]
MGFFFESDVDRRRREAREEWQLREDIKYERRLQSEAKREENAQEREARRAAERRATELKNDRKKQIEEYKKAEIAARPPITRRVGGTRDVKVVTVTHHKASVPVAFLPPHSSGHKIVNAVQALAARGKNVSVDDAAKANDLYAEIERDYGALLSRLRDHGWWDSLCDSVGVTLTRDGKPRPWKGRYAEGVQKVTLVHSPVIIGVKVAADGLRVRIKARIGDGAGRWSTPAKLDLLRAAFQAAGVNAAGMTVTSDPRGNIVIRFNDRDPLAEPLPQVIHPYDAATGRSYLGKAADDSDVFVTWKNNACVLVAGMQGGGKTASLMPMLAGMVGKVELHILDGAASGEWAVLEPACTTYDDSGDIDGLAPVMEYVLNASRERMQVIKRAGHINFWDMDAAQRKTFGLQPMVIVVEEAPVYLADGQLGKDAKAAAADNQVLAGKVVKLVRKAGITLVIIAQKPMSTEIPSVIRDMAGARVCFRLDSDTAAATVLGDSAFAEPKPTTIPAGKPGRFVARVDARGNLLGQAVYVPVAGIREHVNAAAGTVKRTATPVQANAGKGSSTPTPEQAAQMTDEERAAWMHRHAVEMGWVPADTVPPTSGETESPTDDDGAAGDF